MFAKLLACSSFSKQLRAKTELHLGTIIALLPCFLLKTLLQLSNRKKSPLLHLTETIECHTYEYDEVS